MKRVYSSKEVIPTRFDIEVEIGYYAESDRVVASQYKGFYVPDGELLPADIREVVDSQAYVDYEDFVESVTDLITEYYGLDVYYKNESKFLSHYFGLLAKDSDGNIILDFNFKLRVSPHDPHRSEESQQHKKEQEDDLLNATGGKKPRPITKSIVVNRETFPSYLDAYVYVDDVIEHTVTIMKRRQKYK